MPANLLLLHLNKFAHGPRLVRYKQLGTKAADLLSRIGGAEPHYGVEICHRIEQTAEEPGVDESLLRSE